MRKEEEKIIFNDGIIGLNIQNYYIIEEEEND